MGEPASSIVYFVLAVIAWPAILQCAYLAVATLLSARPRVPKPSHRGLRFDVIVPAHNEGPSIARTVTSLAAVDWPREAFRILVVADNCTDDTAAVAARAGATVIERHDPARRGKGYALDLAFRTSREHGWADAVAVIDADAEVSANLLEAYAARLEAGLHAVQAHYGVLNPHASWRTRLITIAKGSIHIVRSRARERLGLSCGIRGNGWCVTHELLRRVPYQAYSLTEDLEYGIALGLAGFRVAYADEAHSNAEMVSGEEVARKQRRRWELGRFLLLKSKTRLLLHAALARRDRVCLDLALDLLVLPLSYIAVNVVVLVAAAGVVGHWVPAAAPWLGVGLVCAAAIVAYVLRGWQLSGTGAQGLVDLLRAPGFVVWKMLLMLRPGEGTAWVRTEREPPTKRTP